jgi:hypothetical protein
LQALPTSVLPFLIPPSLFGAVRSPATFTDFVVLVYLCHDLLKEPDPEPALSAHTSPG